MPDRAKQPFPGDKSYLMTNPGRILVFRQFLFLAGHPFHDSRVEIVRASRRDTKISVLIQAFDRVLRGLAEISLVQQMKNSVGEEGANFLPRPAPEHGAHIAGVEAGASSQRNTIFLPLLVRSPREGNGLWRYVNSDDIKAQLNKIERISSVSASPIDDLHAFRSAAMTVQKCFSQCLGSRARRKSPQPVATILVVLLPCFGDPRLVRCMRRVRPL